MFVRNEWDPKQGDTLIFTICSLYPKWDRCIRQFIRDRLFVWNANIALKIVLGMVHLQNIPFRKAFRKGKGASCWFPLLKIVYFQWASIKKKPWKCLTPIGKGGQQISFLLFPSKKDHIQKNKETKKQPIIPIVPYLFPGLLKGRGPYMSPLFKLFNRKL